LEIINLREFVDCLMMLSVPTKLKFAPMLKSTMQIR